MLVAFVVLLGSCVGDDIDDLQGQIDDLNEQVQQLEEAQKAALSAQLQLLMAEIEDLKAENAERIANSEEQANNIDQLEADYTDLLEQIALLEDLIAQNADGVEGNKNMIYFGDVNNESAYASFAAQEGATVIVGKVKIESQAQAELLANVTYVGGSVEIINIEAANSIVLLPSLKTIAGDLLVGLDWDKTNKYSQPSTSANTGLVAVAMPELKFIGSVRINNFFSAGGTGSGAEDNDGLITTLNLGGASVSGDAWFGYLNKATTINIGAVAGNLNISKCNSTIVEINGNIGGDFTFYNNKLTTLLTGSCSSIGGNVAIESNGHKPQVGDVKGMAGELLSSVTTIGGDIKLWGNHYLPGSNIEVNWFKNLISWKGLLIDIYEFSGGYATLKLFNNLEDDRFLSYTPYGTPQVKVIVPTGLASLEAFNSATKIGHIDFNSNDAQSVFAFKSLTGCHVSGGPSKFDFSGSQTVDALNVFTTCRFSSSAIEIHLNSTQDKCSMNTFLQSVADGSFVGNPVFFVDDAEVTDVTAFITSATSGC